MANARTANASQVESLLVLLAAIVLRLLEQEEQHVDSANDAG